MSVACSHALMPGVSMQSANYLDDLTRLLSGQLFPRMGGTTAAAPPLFRPSDPALCGGHL